MATKAKTASPAHAAVFGRGMKKKELERSGNFGETVYIKKGDTVPVQFYHSPDDFVTFKEHQWQEDHKWYFVPCLGEECPLCEDESDDRSRTGYQFAAQVYNIKEKKPQILKGGKDLGGRVYFRFERNTKTFTKRVLEITKFATQPISFEVSPGDDKPIDLTKVPPIDLEEWLNSQIQAYYGDEVPSAGSLDDDEDAPTDADDGDDDATEPEPDADEDADAEAETEDEPELSADLQKLVDAAGDEDDDAAKEKLNALAKKYKLDPDEYDDWEDQAQAIQKAQAAAPKAKTSAKKTTKK